MRILVVDDESEIRNVIKLLLSSKGYEVVEAKNGEEAVGAVMSDKEIDLCIMDIMMPKKSGIAATAEIRSFSTVPILFLTAKSIEKDKERAYGVGGDDYIVKPFSASELIMKVDALTRRYNSYAMKTKSGSLTVGDVTVDTERRVVTKHDTELDVRDREYEMLLYLVKNRGRTVSADELYKNVWNELPLPSSGNTITVHVLNLRKKLEDDPSSPKLIRTVWGKGYQID